MEDANQISEGLGEILRQSCRLMARNGYHGTSMRDIADSDEIERMSADVREWFAANKTNGMW